VTDRSNSPPSFETALRHQQFSAIDTFRRMQGNVLETFGFGPVESRYRVIASGSYCAEAVTVCLAAIASGSHGTKPTLMGHSLGGTLAAICAATAPASIGGLVLLGSPLCFRPDESPFRDALVSLLPEAVSESEPYPGSILSHASAAASPDTFVWSRLTDAFLSLADERARDIHARVERWALDEVALPGKLVREIVELLYRENRFCRGTLKVGEQIIGPENLSAPHSPSSTRLTS